MLPFLTTNRRQLNEIQSNILIVILTAGVDFVNNEFVLNAAGISKSTWAAEQNELAKLRLIEKIPSRIITNGKILKTVNFRITEKGQLVALNLLRISAILESKNEVSVQDLGELKAQELLMRFDGNHFVDCSNEIREAIEVAIESYGTNFLRDVRIVLEREHHVKWFDIVNNTEKLSFVLRDFFGLKGAKTIESMICDDVRSRFGLDPRKNDNLQSLISGVSAREIRGLTATTTPEE
jgi:hypothetical protein